MVALAEKPVTAAAAPVSSASVVFPNTLAGQILQAWIEAFNSGDRDRMQSFIHQYRPHDSVDQMLAFHNATGNLELLSIEKNDRSHVTFRVLQRATSRTATGQLDLSRSSHAHIRNLNFSGLDQLTPGSKTVQRAFR